jgi:DNA-binding FadR family transcriptional regulator
VRGYYAARIAAARQTLSPAALAVAIRAIKNEQTAAIRAIIEWWEGYFQNRKRAPRPERPSGATPLLRYPGLRKN